MSRRSMLKLLVLLAACGTSGCGKSDTEEKKERPLPPDRLPPDAKK